MILKIGNRAAITVANFHQASTAYATARNESGEGASTFPDGVIMADGQPVARVSYNAKVWSVKEWEPGDLPLYDPYGGPERAA